jgi:hypothetical protein
MSPFLSFLFWGSLSFSEKEDLIGVAMVVIGVLGEVGVEIASIWLPYNPTNFPSLEKILGFKKKHLEIIFVSLVAIGVGLELYALPKSLNESHNKISELDNRTEALRNENLKLELIIRPRGFTQGQIEEGVALLKKYAGTKADVSAMMNDWETIGFARPLNAALAGSGWNVGNDVGFVMEQGRGAEDGVFISTNEFSNIAAATALNDFLNGCGIESRLLPPIYGRFRSSQDALYIRVGTKPPPTIPAK